MSELLSARLLSAKSFVREGAVFADVGTDHGYLPISLFREGKIARAVLSDIHEGPLASAKENLKNAGFSERTVFFLTDGAAALADCGITDMAICGMGGELIADIIARAPFLKEKRVRLILQPMTRIAHLRRCLAEEGYAVLDEHYSREGSKTYVCLLAEYDGIVRSITDAEGEFGTLLNKKDLSAAERSFAESRLASLKKAQDGKMLGGEDASYETEILSMCEQLFAK